MLSFAANMKTFSLAFWFFHVWIQFLVTFEGRDQ